MPVSEKVTREHSNIEMAKQMTSPADLRNPGYAGMRSPEKMRDDNIDRNYYDAIITCP